MDLKERNASVMAKPRTPKALPKYQEIELLAYQIYQERGSDDGQDIQDWLEAETRLLEAFDAHPDRKARAPKS